jgi:hypothetical protein
VARAAIALKRRLGADAPLGWGTWALEALGCLAVFTYVQSQAPRAEPWSIASSLQAARGDQAGSNAARISRRARFFAEHVAPRATLMAPVAHDYDLPMHCNCRALAFRRGRGNRNVPDVDARRQAADQFYASDTPASARAELLKRYGIVYIYSSARRAPRLARELAPRVVTTVSDGEDAIIQLAPSP